MSVPIGNFTCFASGAAAIIQMSDRSKKSHDTGKSDNHVKGDSAPANEIDDHEEEPQQKLDKTSAQNAADLEKVTDISEEREFSGGSNASALLSNVASEQAKTASAGPLVITLKKVDIDALMEHFDVKRLYAEKLLKRHQGDLKKAVRELMGINRISKNTTEDRISVPS